MSWLWIGVAVGLLSPWFLIKDALCIAFEEKGMVGGMGFWLGTAVLTVPLFVGIMWLGQKFF